jgi:hypothetical protein
MSDRSPCYRLLSDSTIHMANEDAPSRALSAGLVSKGGLSGGRQRQEESRTHIAAAVVWPPGMMDTKYGPAAISLRQQSEERAVRRLTGAALPADQNRLALDK